MRRLVSLLVLLLVLAPSLDAARVKIFRTRSQSAFLEGTLDGVRVDPLGTLRLADRAVLVEEIAEPFVFSAAPHPDGWVVGTGNSGRVLLVGRDGGVKELFSTEEPEVFTVWVAPDGTVYAGSSPHGKVYRYVGQEAEIFFDPKQTYIWGLAGTPDGSLAVATGTEGLLFRVDARGRGEVLFDAEDTHIRTLTVLDDGWILAGTAGEGLVLEVAGDGRVRTLFDALQPEIVAFAVDGEGARYVAALASEASFVDLTERSRRERSSSQESEEENENESGQVTVVEQGSEEVASGSRTPGFRGSRSIIVKIAPSGSVQTVWRFQDETVYALLWHRDRLWVGTGMEGKVYSYQGSKMVLEKDFEERQVVGLVPHEPGPAFATTNGGALYRQTSGTQRQGIFTSSILDAEQISRFGSLHWEGRVPEGSGATFSFRSGVSANPDQTWSDWSAPRSGRQIALEDVPRGRYLQWRVELESANGSSPHIYSVELSYLQENLKPEITSLDVMDPGKVLVPSNFNPASQVYEPAHPNREGIFTSIGEPSSGKESGRLKTLWRKGYRTLRWKAEDPNDDELEYSVFFRREEDANGWLPMTKELEETHYSFDSSVLPDGLYRFRLVASDVAGNRAPDALEAEQITESVVVDHAPPVLGQVTVEGESLRVTLSDELSPIREVVYSVDAGDWKPARVLDQLLDGRTEEVALELTGEARLILLRATDAAFNVVTFDLSDQAR